MTTGEAAKAVGVSAMTIRNWIDRGYLHAVRLPSGHRRIPEEEIARLLDMGMPVEEEPSRTVRSVAVSDEEWGP